MPTARYGGKKLYVKLYPVDCFEGSIRYQLEADERGVWYDLIMFAGLCGKEGWICDKDNRGYPLTFIANRLNVDQELFDRTLKKCYEEGRLQDHDEKGLFIVNFKDYQSEYQRQKQYRGTKSGKTRKQGSEEIWECPSCHYSVDYCKHTESWEECPNCARKGKTTKMVRKKAAPWRSKEEE